ncbi:hypothetical protein LXL04_015489 [Taraxacum kok-saghyz]
MTMRVEEIKDGHKIDIRQGSRTGFGFDLGYGVIGLTKGNKTDHLGKGCLSWVFDSRTLVLFVFSKPKHLQSADHICKPLQQKRWTKRLQSTRRRLLEKTDGAAKSRRRLLCNRSLEKEGLLRRRSRRKGVAVARWSSAEMEQRRCWSSCEMRSRDGRKGSAIAKQGYGSEKRLEVIGLCLRGAEDAQTFH